MSKQANCPTCKRPLPRPVGRPKQKTKCKCGTVYNSAAEARACVVRGHE
jgi:hypothetical protein